MGMYIGIIAAAIVLLILLLVIMHHAMASLIFSVILNLPIVVISIIAVASKNYELLSYAGWLAILAGMFTFGPYCFEDTRKTNTYLIGGSLVEETTGDSPVKTFFTLLGACALFVGIPMYGVSTGSYQFVGACIILGLSGFMTLAGIVSIIKGHRV